MKKKILSAILLTIILNPLTYPKELEQKHIVVLTCSYNNKKWYQENIKSFTDQDYKNKTMLYIDDCSPDGTGNLVQEYIKDNNLEKDIILIKNTKNMGAMANQYNAITSCKNDDIIVIYDGDDFFEDNNVLSFINKVYQDPDVWLTYGQFRYMSDGRRGFCSPIDMNIVKNNTFREFAMHPSHLRTFYAGLFKKVRKEDFMFNGAFLTMTCDVAAMIPMIEMARDGHFRFIPKILYVYNDLSPINDHKINRQLQYDLDVYIRSRQKYDPIVSPLIN